MKTIQIHEDNFIPKFWDLLDSRAKILITYGGAGSGKSVCVVQKILMRTIQEKGHRFLCLRKVKSDIEKSIFQLFKDIISHWKLEDEFEYNLTKMTITHLASGNQIVTAGLDDSDRLKSITGITGIWVEEADEIEMDDFTQLLLRLRTFTETYRQIILSFNPTSEDCWIKQELFDHPDPDIKIIHSTYKDNPFLDQEYITTLESRMKNNPDMYRIYVLGEWGRTRTGGEFYKHFDYSKNVGAFSYNPDIPLHISFDFNVQPGVHVGVFQVIGQRAIQIDEIRAASPNNSTGGACKLFKHKYPDHNTGLFIYGDPSGKQADTRTEQGFNDYTIINRELAKYRPMSRVSSKHPPVVARGNWINSIFEFNEDVQLFIDSRCKLTIADLENIKQSADGTKEKKRRTDPKTGVSYEQYGHLSDLLDYFMVSCFRTEWINYQRGGKPTSNYTVGYPVYSNPNSNRY